MISLQTPILIGVGKNSPADLDRAIKWTLARGAPKEFAEAYLRFLFDACQASGINFQVMCGQFWDETDGGTSEIFRKYGNPVGLGAFPDGTYVGGYFTPDEAAWAQVVHALAYVIGRIPKDHPAAKWTHRDPRYEAVLASGMAGDLDIVGDYGRGLHATNPKYAPQIVSRANAVFTAEGGGDVSTPGKITFGNVPHPPYHNRPIWKAEGVGMNNLGKRTVKGVSWHRILGTLWGTDGFFRDPSVKALTDYGVGVLAQDGAANDGVILRWNDPLGFQSGWASGTYSKAHAYGDGAAFADKYGVNAINRDRASIEISGFQNTALSEKSREAVAAITAYWADQYGIPWDVFPIAPQDGFSFVTWHEEFGPDFGQKKCPFDVVKRETPDLIERTRQIMKRHQTAPSAEPTTPDISEYASPITYEWLAPEAAAEGEDRAIGDVEILYLPQIYTAIRETPRKQTAGGELLVGPPIRKGLRFRADYVFRFDGASYVLTPAGTRVRAADLLPKIQISESGTISMRRTADQKKGEVVRKAGDRD